MKALCFWECKDFWELASLKMLIHARDKVFPWKCNEKQICVSCAGPEVRNILVNVCEGITESSAVSIPVSCEVCQLQRRPRRFPLAATPQFLLTQR